MDTPMIAKMYFDISHLRFDTKNVNVFLQDSDNANNNVVSLSNNDDRRKEYCFGKLSSEYGRSMHNYIPDSVFGYCEFNILDLKYNSTETGIISSFYDGYIQEFNRRAAHLESLLVFLWFIKDNSVGIYGTYGQIPDAKIVNGKSRSIVNYTCTGEISNIPFSGLDLQSAGKLVTKYSAICGLSRKVIDDTNMLWEYGDGGSAKAISPKISESFSYKDQTAIDRAIHFLVIARNQNYLMYKIAYYMPIFECLFNTFGTEITFRIAQRAAYYIGTCSEERKDIFDTVSKGYDFRSKLFHGAGLEDDKKLESANIKPIAIALDGYLRRILLKAITEDHLVFNNYPTKIKNIFFDNPILGLDIDAQALKADHELREKQARETKNKMDSKRLKSESQNRKK